MRKFVKNIIEMFTEYDVYFAHKRGVIYKAERNLSRMEVMELLNTQKPNDDCIVFRRINRENIIGVSCCWAVTLIGSAMMYVFG